jgi:RNA-binding protein YhbY
LERVKNRKNKQEHHHFESINLNSEALQHPLKRIDKSLKPKEYYKHVRVKKEVVVKEQDILDSVASSSDESVIQDEGLRAILLETIKKEKNPATRKLFLD